MILLIIQKVLFQPMKMSYIVDISLNASTFMGNK